MNEVKGILEIFLTHVSLNSAGGGELVCLSILKALRKSGNRVTLVTVDKTDWKRVRKILGEMTVPDQEIYMFSCLPKTSSSWLNSTVLVVMFWAQLLSLRMRKQKNHLIINTCGEKIDSLADLSYVNGIPLRYASLLARTSSGRKGYSAICNLILKAFDRIRSGPLLVNSRFTKSLIEKRYKNGTLVLYPPVKVEKFKDLATKRKKNLVITYSQYIRTQNLRYVPRIADIAKDGQFFIIGPSLSSSKGTLVELRRMIGELSLEHRVQLLVNQPFSKYIELLSAAKIFLRTLPNEPFGMSIVEAMAAGCIPVVPRSGGPWLDILDEEQGKYGFSYASIEESAHVICELLRNERLRTEVSLRAQGRALEFENSHFETKISTIVDSISTRR